jgi:hypothetical protein
LGSLKGFIRSSPHDPHEEDTEKMNGNLFLLHVMFSFGFGLPRGIGEGTILPLNKVSPASPTSRSLVSALNFTDLRSKVIEAMSSFSTLHLRSNRRDSPRFVATNFYEISSKSKCFVVYLEKVSTHLR